VNDQEGWLGNIKTREVAPFDQFDGNKREAVWFPDEASAKAWRKITREQ
jgi:hypothetical protein